MRRPVFFLAAAAIVLMPALLFAGNYDLVDCEFIKSEHVKAFVKLKIETTAQLAEALATPAKRADISKKTSAPAAEIEEYGRITDLLRIKGVGPRIARLMRVCGIQHVTGLKSAAAADLLKLMAQNNDVHHITNTLPLVETVQDWINQAKALPTLFE